MNDTNDNESVNDKDFVNSASNEAEDGLLMIQKMRQDAESIDGSVDNELQRELFAKLSDTEFARETNNYEGKIVAFPFKKVILPTAVAASFLAIFVLANLAPVKQDITSSSVAIVEDKKVELNKSTKNTSAIGSKHLETEMVAIKADFDKLKARIASL